MNLNILYLLNELSKNTNEILNLIHKDEKITKRYCPVLNLYIANASKELFTPEKQHHLYAKGIIYTINDSNFELISMPLLKIYNFGENQDVKTHVMEMISTNNVESIYLYKADGTCVQRFVYNNKVVLATRGMIETIAETDEQKQYFKWAREIIATKYPNIDNPDYLKAGTSIFELVGPENQIVTFYPEWDLIMTGYCKVGTNHKDFFGLLGDLVNNAFKFPLIEYWPHHEVVGYSEKHNFGRPINKLYAFGNTIEEQIQSINKLFSSTDDEGSVIQFEKKDDQGITRVIGRVKAKTDNYRQLLKIMSGCTYEKIAEIIMTDLVKFKYWDRFEDHLKSFGAEKFPEELMQNYKLYFNDFWDHYGRCKLFLEKIAKDTNQIIDKNKIKFSFGYHEELVLDKKSRAEFANAKEAIQHPYKGCLFAQLDGTLTMARVLGKILVEPSDSINALRKLLA